MSDKPKMKLGVVGGLGPIATAVFLEQIIKMTDAASDQEHMDIIIYNFPSIPDRTRFILGKSTDNPVVPIIEIGRQLVGLGVDYIAIPCITAHYFYRQLSDSIGRPVINMIRKTAAHLAACGVETAGIAATDGTLAGRLFQNELDMQGIRSVIPSARTQRYLMELIYDNIKAGTPADMDKFGEISGELRQSGAETIILGCTELSLIKRDSAIGPGFLDAMDVLAMSSVLACGYPLKSQYACLIT
jgi:aspartate racemase